MKRAVVPLLISVAVVVFVAWISKNTYWDEVEIPALPKGEAQTNPFYAAQRFVEALGARSSWDRVLTIPPASSVIVLSDWNWTLSDRRRTAIERWVESGGRLVVDRGLMGGPSEFQDWSGIVRASRKKTDEERPSLTPHCDRFREERAGAPVASSDARLYWICDFDEGSTLSTARRVAWSLSGKEGTQAMRVDVGKGSVTVINAWPFRERGLFDGDHGWLFVTATGLHRGDDVHFLSEENHPSLLALVWLYGRPVVLLALTLVGLGLWRGSVRLGPLAPAPQAERRSLAEQIRGTGRFALRYGGGEALHAACARALEEAAQRRISGYQHLPARERAARLAELTGFDRDGLAAAIYHPGLRQSHELRDTIETLEAARRMLIQRTMPRTVFKTDRVWSGERARE